LGQSKAHLENLFKLITQALYSLGTANQVASRSKALWTLSIAEPLVWAEVSKQVADRSLDRSFEPLIASISLPIFSKLRPNPSQHQHAEHHRKKREI
jgi:hypothetical protein